jgi:hypothetical protein
MRRRRGRSIVQIEGIERLETRITPSTPATPASMSLIGHLFSDPTKRPSPGGEVGGTGYYGRSYFGENIAIIAKVHLSDLV